MVGHKTESTYRRYAIVTESDLREAAGRLRRFMTSKSHPTGPMRLTSARDNEGTYAWSASVGASVLVTGLTEVMAANLQTTYLSPPIAMSAHHP
jgi:hypothetical protein